MTAEEFAKAFGDPAPALPPPVTTPSPPVTTPSPPPAPGGDAGMSAADFARGFAQPAPAAAPGPDPNAMVFDPTSGLAIPTAALTPQPEDPATVAARNTLLRFSDTQSSAPAEVRAAVGASDDPATRLARLQKYYPDAQPLPGTDNFVFTNEQGQRQTYAPMSGFRWSNLGPALASAGSAIAEGAGAIGGGAGGAVIGGGLPGAMLGGGAGATALKELYDRGLAWWLDLPDLRSPQQQVADAGTTAAVNAVLPGLTEGAGKIVARGLLAPGAGTATQQAANALDAAGVTTDLAGKLPLGAATESPGWQRAESAVIQSPTGGAVKGQYDAAKTELNQGVQNLAQAATPAGAPVPTPDTFAQTTSDIANQIIRDQVSGATPLGPGGVGSQLKADLYNQLGATPVQFNNLQSTLTMLRRRAAMPNMASIYEPAIQYGQNILDAANARGGALPFSQVMTQRTMANGIPDWIAPGGAAKLEEQPGRDIATAIRSDLWDAAQANSPPGSTAGVKALNDYDSFWQKWMDSNNGPSPNQTLNGLASPATRADTLQKLMMQTSPKSQADLANLWHYATPEQRGTLQAGIMNTLGDSPGGFDMATFNRNWAKLNQPQKDLVFGSGPGSQAEALDNLAQVQNSMKVAEATRGHSNTGAVLAVMNMFSHLVSSTLAGEPGEAVKTVGTQLAAPFGAARLLQSRPFVNALSGVWGVDPAQAGSWGRFLGNLTAAGEADPAVKDLVHQFVQGLPQQPPQQ